MLGPALIILALLTVGIQIASTIVLLDYYGGVMGYIAPFFVRKTFIFLRCKLVHKY